MTTPPEPRTSREALVALTLEELDGVLTRAEQVSARIAEESARIETAAVALHTAGAAYLSDLNRFTSEARDSVGVFIERRTTAATTSALDAHSRALQEAATLAFAAQLTPAIQDFTRQVEQLRNAPKAPNARRPMLWFAAGAVVAALLYGVALLAWTRP